MYKIENITEEQNFQNHDDFWGYCEDTETFILFYPFYNQRKGQKHIHVMSTYFSCQSLLKIAKNFWTNLTSIE